MKTSNRILLAIGITAVVVAVAAVVVARIVIDDVVTVPLASGTAPRGTVASRSSGATKSYDLRNFTGISASGAWDIRVTEAAGYKVTVSVPEDVVPQLNVYASGEVLHVSLKPGTTMTDRRLTAEISMPSLDRVQLSGANRASISGFKGDRLTVECTGAASVTGSGEGYRQLQIDASGASSVKFRDLPTRNADVRLSGAGRAELSMTGGRLTGQLTGAGKILYWGTVSKQTVETSGIASVSHR